MRFLACYVPVFCLSFSSFIGGSTAMPFDMWYYVFTLMYLNSSLNPLIYSWKIRGIRQVVVDIRRNTLPNFWLKEGSRKESREHCLFLCERQLSNTCKSPGGVLPYKRLMWMCCCTVAICNNHRTL